MKKYFLLFVLISTLIIPSCKKSDNTSGSGSSGGGSTPKYGDVTFWQSESSSTITVTFRGEDRKITKYYPGYDPDCGSSGCANYTNVPVGNYSFHAENFWHSWNGDITVTAGNCSRMRLSFDKAETKSQPSGDDTMMICADDEDESCMD